MAFGWIPMNQTVKVHKQTMEKLDKWGMPVHEVVSKDYKVRIESNFNRESVKFGDGTDVVFDAVILFKGLVDVRDSDLLEWVDDFGRTVKKSPVTVSVLKDFSGKVQMTKVVV